MQAIFNLIISGISNQSVLTILCVILHMKKIKNIRIMQLVCAYKYLN